MKGGPTLSEIQDEEVFDICDASACVQGLCRAHPLRTSKLWGSAIGAKLAAFVMGLSDGEVHPKSIIAMRMAAVVDGVGTAVIDRLRAELSWTEDQAEALEWTLFDRRRSVPCMECGAVHRDAEDNVCSACNRKALKDQSGEVR